MQLLHFCGNLQPAWAFNFSFMRPQWNSDFINKIEELRFYDIKLTMLILLSSQTKRRMSVWRNKGRRIRQVPRKFDAGVSCLFYVVISRYQYNLVAFLICEERQELLPGVRGWLSVANSFPALLVFFTLTDGENEIVRLPHQ